MAWKRPGFRGATTTAWGGLNTPGRIAGRGVGPGPQIGLNPCKNPVNTGDLSRAAGAPRSARATAQLADGLGAQRRVQARDHLACEKLELGRPDRGLAGDGQDAVALGDGACRG